MDWAIYAICFSAPEASICLHAAHSTINSSTTLFKQQPPITSSAPQRNCHRLAARSVILAHQVTVANKCIIRATIEHPYRWLCTTGAGSHWSHSERRRAILNTIMSTNGHMPCLRTSGEAESGRTKARGSEIRSRPLD